MTETEMDPSGLLALSVDAADPQAVDGYDQHPEQAAQIFEQAVTLAQTGAFASQPNRADLAASLAGLAKLHTDSRPELAAQYCLQILSLLEGFPILPPLIEAKNRLGWIYFHQGDDSIAMEWALQALHHSQEGSLPVQEAMALDLIANIQSMLHDFPQASRTYEAALVIVRSQQKPEQEANLLNQIARTQMAMGHLGSALETGLTCFRMCQEQQMMLGMANCCDTLAQIHFVMGDFRQAENDLLNGLEMVATIHHPLLQTELLIRLGRVSLAQNDLPRAIVPIEKALTIAQQNGLRGALAECHQLLATIDERRSDDIGALQHFKQFHAVQQEIAGDTASKRLAIMHMIYTVEKAKQEAERYRLRNIELQAEIAERKRIQGILEELATRDPLTSLFNRRVFLEKSIQEYERAIRYRHPMAVIMLDLDHFKGVNDTYGHAIGDQVLAMVGTRLKEFIRSVDIAGRMGGEEFALVFPETTLDGARQAVDRLCTSFSTESFVIHPYAIRVTASVGLTCFLPGASNGPLSFDALLQQADQALYMAKNSGRDQVQVLFSTIEKIQVPNQGCSFDC